MIRQRVPARVLRRTAWWSGPRHPDPDPRSVSLGVSLEDALGDPAPAGDLKAVLGSPRTDGRKVRSRRRGPLTSTGTVRATGPARRRDERLERLLQLGLILLPQVDLVAASGVGKGDGFSSLAPVDVIGDGHD